MKSIWRGLVSLFILTFVFSLHAQGQSQSMFTSQAPQELHQSDGSNMNYELGTAFRSNAAGQVTAIRFWKDSLESGTHTGHLWSSTGQMLATVTFANESASGWQVQSLSSAVSIAANKTYYVTVNTGATYYVTSENGLASQINNGNLSTVVGKNGVYGTSGRFPTSSWNASNYFRDVIFVASNSSSGSGYAISGIVSGTAGSGATMQLSGQASATTAVSSSGRYSFTGLANGTYTLTPSKSGTSFSPSSQTMTVNGADMTVATFTATSSSTSSGQTFTISGSATPSSGTSGATVTLSGAASATTTVSGSGNYSFTGLANGNYAVTPSKSGYNFSPSVQAVTINGSSSTSVNFTASASSSTFTISGTITPVSAGSGATITLSGAASATTTANSSGSFLFSGLSSGNYVVTPSSSSASFSPAKQNVTINAGNPSSVNFTASTSSNVIFYDDFSESSLTADWWALNVAANVNGQQECYTPNLVSLQSGYLQIQTVAQSTTCNGSKKSYGSGAAIWSNFSFTYGTVEFRAKMPGGTGPWPAIWLLGVDCRGSNANQYNSSGCNWPNTGSEEIDITEILNSDHTSINQQIHVASGSPGCSATATDVSQNFHVYDLIWSQGKLVWQIDGNTTCTVTQGVPADAMFMIINTSVGGCCGGTPVNSTFPQNMEVDYVKVTKP